jgi:hypothetical protein
MVTGAVLQAISSRFSSINNVDEQSGELNLITSIEESANATDTRWWLVVCSVVALSSDGGKGNSCVVVTVCRARDKGCIVVTLLVR